MRIQFTKRFEIIGKSLSCSAKCQSHLKCNNRIKQGEAHWRSGTISGSHRYGICQQCFGFWLSRYYDFDFVGDLDKKDIAAKVFADREWDTKSLEEWFADFDLRQRSLALAVGVGD